MLKAARLVIFGGWILPALLARVVPGGAAPELREAARMFDIVAGAWAFLAVLYAAVLAVRLRRGIAD
jgi:hypothetical protein